MSVSVEVVPKVFSGSKDMMAVSIEVAKDEFGDFTKLLGSGVEFEKAKLIGIVHEVNDITKHEVFKDLV